MLEDVLIVSVVFFFIYKTIEVLARRRERLMMVEAFARNPELCRERGGSFRMEILRDVYGVLRPCGFIVGLGIGFLVSWLIMPENEVCVWGTCRNGRLCTLVYLRRTRHAGGILCGTVAASPRPGVGRSWRCTIGGLKGRFRKPAEIAFCVLYRLGDRESVGSVCDGNGSRRSRPQRIFRAIAAQASASARAW